MTRSSVAIVTRRLTHSAAIIVLGFAAPIFMLIQAYLNLSTLAPSIKTEQPWEQPLEAMRQVRPLLKTGNDYALYALISAERTNLKVISHKQIMKVAIMQIGFATISLGLMLVLLGVKEGEGPSGSLSLLDVSIDIRRASPGVFVFVVGAAMATAGGVIKNDYGTVPIPDFLAQAEAPSTGAIELYRACRADFPDDYEHCFAKGFEASLAKDNRSGG